MSNPTNYPTTIRRNTVGALVTLTNANTKYNLGTLVNTILSTVYGADITVGSACRQVIIQSYPGLAGVGANTAEILLGDAYVAPTFFGVLLTVGSIWSDRSSLNNVTWGDLYARSAAAGQKLSVMITFG